MLSLTNIGTKWKRQSCCFPLSTATTPHKKLSRRCLKLAVTLTVVCVTSVSVYSALFAFLPAGIPSSTDRYDGTHGGNLRVARLYPQQHLGSHGSFPGKKKFFPRGRLLHKSAESGWEQDEVPSSKNLNVLSRSDFNRRLTPYREPKRGRSVFGFQSQGLVSDHCSDCSHFSMPPVPEKIRRICGDAKDTKLDLVIIVASDAGGFEERRVLRETWLTPTGKWASRVWNMCGVFDIWSLNISH